MTENASATTNVYALLIGVDHYLELTLPGGVYYPKLSGCVPDIERVEAFLKAELGLTDDQIVKLTATNVPGDEPPEPEEERPTYENMVAAFKKVTVMAQEGDQVYVHYSGHGSRATTIYPELKGAGTHDEGLVPMDIGKPEARYLRDLELARLFQDMVDKGIILSVVLDSCHSGGTTRAADVAVRGIDKVDTTPRPTDSLVASVEELTATWKSTTEGQTRALKPDGDWLPKPEGYTLLAACGPQQYAHEYEVESGQRGGALTYWMLNSIKPLGPGFSYKMLYNRVLPKVHTMFPQQTPQLQGIGSRTVLGRETVQPVQAVNVMQVDEVGQKVLLGTGQVQAVAKGAQFAVYPEGTTNLTQVEKRRGVVEISELGATSSWAKVVNQFDQGELQVGDQAVLLDPGKVRLKRRVRLFRYEPGELPPTVDQDAALGKVQAALEAEPTGWVGLASEGEEVDYEVSVSEAGTYEICDRGGNPIPNLRPPLQIDDAGAAAGVVQRLVHLTKYSNLLLLENHDRSSPLARGLDVEILRAQPDFEPGDPPEPQPFEDPSAVTGDWLFARITNKSSQVLNVAVLDMSPDWSITQVHPTWADFVALDPDAEEIFPLVAGLPEGYEEGVDVLKVFATLGPANFKWLELPELDNPPTRKAAITRSVEEGDPLEQILAAFTDDQPKTRNLNPAEYPSRGWATAQVEVHIKKPQAG